MHRQEGAIRPAAVLLLAVACVLGAACSPPAGDAHEAAPQHDPDQAREAVVQAHEQLLAAFEAGDVETLTGLMLPAPELLIFHARLENRFDGHEQVREGLTRMLGRFGTASWWEAHPTVSVEGNVAWMTSHVVVESPGLAEPFLGRGTEIWVWRPEGWKLAHGHWSPVP